MTNSGTSSLLSSALTTLSANNPTVFIVVLYMLISTLTQFLDGRTLVIITRVAVSLLCIDMGLPLVPMMTLLNAAANACFMFPAGAGHNQFAHLAGNYKIMDWLRAGWVLQITNTVATIGFMLVWIQFSGAGQASPEAQRALRPAGSVAAGDGGVGGS